MLADIEGSHLDILWVAPAAFHTAPVLGMRFEFACLTKQSLSAVRRVKTSGFGFN